MSQLRTGIAMPKACSMLMGFCGTLLVVCAGVANGVTKRAKHAHHWQPAAIVLDIEGTVAPISFVADVMFPHARDNVRAFLNAHYNSGETRADINAIRQQVGRAQQG